MSYLLMALLLTSATYAKQNCISDSNLDELSEALSVTNNCNVNDLEVTPICRTPDGATLWTVDNNGGVACESNSNFSHNLVYHNLASTWPADRKWVCGAYWTNGNDLTLNVTGDNALMNSSTRNCTEAEKQQALGLCGLSTLPIHLVSFSASPGAGACVDLNFVTGSEENSKEVVIERSLDAGKFTTVKAIKSNSPSGGAYSYQDCDPKYQKNYYYRLRQVDNDGRSQTFATKAVTLNIAEPKIYPVPAKETLTVGFHTQGVPEVQVIIHNTSGQLVRKEKIPVPQNSEGVVVDLKNILSSGVYFIQVYDLKENKIIHGKNGKFVLAK